MPLRLEAAILSRMRSPVTSRSNCAKERSTFSVSRPMLVVVLKACVIETNETCRLSKISTILAKSDSARVRRSTDAWKHDHARISRLRLLIKHVELLSGSAAPHPPKRLVQHDPGEPGTEGRLASKARQRRERAHISLLQDVLGLGLVRHHPLARRDRAVDCSAS